MKRLSKEDVIQIAAEFGVPYAALMAVVGVESGGKGFSDDGKLIIQFEPTWFKRKSPYTPSGLWSQNGVERQAREWLAFNDAYHANGVAAMLSTSIGLMQVMGFNFFACGFKSVNDMWDYCKASEANQLRVGLRFIRSNKRMYAALKTCDWATFAYYYNGEKYRDFHYDTRLAEQYEKYN